MLDVEKLAMGGTHTCALHDTGGVTVLVVRALLGVQHEHRRTACVQQQCSQNCVQCSHVPIRPSMRAIWPRRVRPFALSADSSTGRLCCAGGAAAGAEAGAPKGS